MFPLPPSEGVYDGKREMRKAEQREGNCSWRHLASMNNQVSSKKKDKITKRYYISYVKSFIIQLDVMLQRTKMQKPCTEIGSSIGTWFGEICFC